MTLRTSAAGGLSRFAHLTGLSRKKADDTPATDDDVKDVKDDVEEIKDDVSNVKDDLEETKDKVQELEEELDDKKDKDEPAEAEPGDDKPAEQAAFRRGRVSGRKAERARCAAIFATPEAGANPTLAASLAFESKVSASEARNLLRASADGASTAAPAAQKSGLDARMGGKPRLELGNGDGAAKPDLNTPDGVAANALAVARRAGVIK